MLSKREIIKVFDVCTRCHQPTKYMYGKTYAPRIANEEEIYNGKKICRDCYNELKLFLKKDYRTNGKNFSISEIERIKIQIVHVNIKHSNTKSNFTFAIYADASQMRKPKTSGMGGNGKEFQIYRYFNDSYMSMFIPKDYFTHRLVGDLSKVRVVQRKILLSNQMFLDYAYECMADFLSILSPRILFYYGI